MHVGYERYLAVDHDLPAARAVEVTDLPQPPPLTRDHGSDLLTCPRLRVLSPQTKEPMMSELSSMASTVGGLLKARGQTVAVAESSAGGLISAARLASPGASAYFLGGVVIYTQAARRALIRIADEAMAGMRSSSEPYALLKARSVRELLGTTWGLSETGASGPTGNRYGDA